jgi:hypothetical protein
MALIMAQCCALSYTQLSQQASPSTAVSASELSGLNVPSGPNETNYTFTQLSYSSVVPFTGSESLGLGFTSTDPGAFVTIPFGFAAQASSSSGTALFNVIALRGTKTYEEWVTDVDIMPTSFALNNASGPGDVPAGFYNVYVRGTDGVAPSSTTPRPQGSIAQQLASLLQSNGWNGSIPLYITGHSLGAALATLTATLHRPDGLFTFGSPLVGDEDFGRTLDGLLHNRYVDCCDLVTRVPPPELFDYRHTGERRFFDRHGTLRPNVSDDDIQRERRAARTQYFFEHALVFGKVPTRDLADHAPINYVSAVMGIP